MTNLQKTIGASLASDPSDDSRKKWIEYIIDNKIHLADLTALLNYKKPVPMRFMWMVGGLCEQKPEMVFPAIPFFFSKRNEALFPNYDRSLAKMFSLCGIPKEIEGEATDQLVKWMLDADITVSTKNFAMCALFNLTRIYPELKNEVKLVIEDQLEKNTGDFDKRARKILARF